MIFPSISWPSVILIVVEAAAVTEVDAAKVRALIERESDRRFIPPPFTVIDFTVTA